MVITTLDYLFYVDILEILSHMNRRASGSIPEEGSSKNIILGFPNVAMAVESFLLLPPES